MSEIARVGSRLEAVPVGDTPSATSLRLSVLTPVFNERHVVEASLRRVLALQHPMIRSLELIIVDDCSTDGTPEVLERLAAQDSRVVFLRHTHNQGKGAAVRTAIARATGDVTVIHDADLEYHPQDIPNLLLPFIQEGADAVLGSRYLSAPYRRALMHRHTVMNRLLTSASNWITDLNISDLETCYKAVRTSLLQSIPLRSNDFRFEVEIVCKLAKRRAIIFETPIRYMPRSYEEGKKIRPRDGVLAVLAMLRYGVLQDDMYKDDEHGSASLGQVEQMRSRTLWLGDTLRPYVGDRVLELGAGIGTLTNQFIPRDSYVAAEVNPHHLAYLTAYSAGKPYLDVARVDPGRREDFSVLEGRFDTAIAVGVLERAMDDAAVLQNIRLALAPGGRLLLVVPQSPQLSGALDENLRYRKRYTVETLSERLAQCGFTVEKMESFDRSSVPTWLVNGRLLRRPRLSKIELKVLNTLVPLARRLDEHLPWNGLNLLAIARKPDRS
jgi:SAM-dependent methyltransferase